MLEKSFGIFFFLKKPKTENADGMRYVYLRLTVDGISREVSTKRLWHRARWNAAAGKAAGNKEDSKSLNHYLESFTSLVYKAKQKLIDGGHVISADAIKDILTGNWIDNKMIIKLFQFHNDQMRELIGKEYAKGTYERYETSLQHTRSFIQWKFDKEDISIKELDYDFIEQYFFWFRTVQNCCNNTTIKYLGNFKKIVLACVKKKWLTSDPFVDFQFKKTKVKKLALSSVELQRIEGKVFSIERVSQVRDIFLFSCYTGLAYIDAKQLTSSDIGPGIDGGLWILSSRQKTESETHIPLLPKALEILAKYKHHPQCQNSGRVLPMLSNQKMNSYLKEIADFCGIEKTLTFHIARHTFATTVTLVNKVPIETVSKMLGHATIKQTQDYAQVVEEKISKDMMDLRLRLDSAV